MGDQTPQTPKDQTKTSAKNLVEGLFAGHQTTQVDWERDYLLESDILAAIKPAFLALGLVIDDDPVPMYDWSADIKYFIYRLPLQQGSMALVHLKDNLTEAYSPPSKMPLLYDWLTNANPDLDIQAVCFFTDGQSVDAPYKHMANTWIKRSPLRFVEFVVQKTWKDLQKLDLDARIVNVKRTFGVDELKPPPGAGPGAQAGGAGGDIPAAGSVDDLQNDGLNKDKLVQALENYMLAGAPLSPKLMAQNLINSTLWPEPVKELRISVLTENANSNARALVDFAVTRGQLPSPHESQTALGNLLEKAKPLLNPADLEAVDQIMEAFNL